MSKYIDFCLVEWLSKKEIACNKSHRWKHIDQYAVVLYAVEVAFVIISNLLQREIIYEKYIHIKLS